MNNNVPALRGAMTALITPFRRCEIDWRCLDDLIDRQLDGGIDWIVPCATTGESPTLSPAEQAQILDAVITRAGKRCPVMAGTGTHSTTTTIERTKAAQRAGAKAALIVTPYYNRPSQEGLFRHYAAVADAVDLPIVLYNVPARTGVHLDNDTVIRLHEQFPHIAAIKHATGSVAGVTELLRQSDIIVLSGDDAMTWPMMSLGAVGVISVISNLVPRLVKSMMASAMAGNHSAAKKHHRQIDMLSRELSKLGSNPVPIKTAMACMSITLAEFRLPLCPLDEQATDAIERLLKRLGILEAVHA